MVYPSTECTLVITIFDCEASDPGENVGSNTSLPVTANINHVVPDRITEHDRERTKEAKLVSGIPVLGKIEMTAASTNCDVTNSGNNEITPATKIINGWVETKVIIRGVEKLPLASNIPDVIETGVNMVASNGETAKSGILIHIECGPAHVKITPFIPEMVPVKTSVLAMVDSKHVRMPDGSIAGEIHHARVHVANSPGMVHSLNETYPMIKVSSV